MTREEYLRFSLGREPETSSGHAMREPSRYVNVVVDGGKQATRPIDAWSLKPLSDTAEGALLDMYRAAESMNPQTYATGRTGFTSGRPSFVGDTYEGIKYMVTHPSQAFPAIIQGMSPNTEGGLTNASLALAGGLLTSPRLALKAKHATTATGKKAKDVIDWMKPTPEGRGKPMSRREFNKAGASSVLPVFTKKGEVPFPDRDTTLPLALLHQKAQYQLDIRDAVNEIKAGKMWELYMSTRLGELNKRADGMPEYLSGYKEIQKEHDALVDGWSEDQAMGNTPTQRHKNLNWATKDAAESGLFTKQEIAEMIHPLYVKSEKWLKKDKAVRKKASDRMKSDMKKWQEEKKARKWEFVRDPRKMHHKGPIRLPVTTRPIVPDHGRTIDFMMPIE